MLPPEASQMDARASRRVSRSPVRYNLGSGSLEGEAGNQKGTDLHLHLQRDALRRLIAPQYVRLAFNLPPGSSTIWHSIKEDIMLHCDANFPPSDPGDLASFLLLFFSPCLVDTVRKNLTRLADSFLGIVYTLRLAKVSLASQILDDTVYEHVYTKGGPLAGFLGDVGNADNEACDADADSSTGGKDSHAKEACDADADSSTGGKDSHAEEGWQEVRRKKGGSQQRSSKPPSRGSESFSSRGGRRGGRRGGGGRWGQGDVMLEEHFMDLQTVEVLLPAYKTPPKVHMGAIQARVAKRQRDINIAERSILFRDHPFVDEGSPYNPEVEAVGSIHMFHGTRASSLGGHRGFRAKGIKPHDKANEFCAEEAFYVSNSVRHAYEHPLHHHLSQGVENPIVVFVFDIDVEMLHGKKPPPGNDVPFKVYWFEEPNDEWEEFCRGNMNKKLPKEDADIVIGPICQVRPPPQRYEALKVELEGGVQLTQVAFCSTRAWQWLEICAIRMYMEKRSEDVSYSIHPP